MWWGVGRMSTEARVKGGNSWAGVGAAKPCTSAAEAARFFCDYAVAKATPYNDFEASSKTGGLKTAATESKPEVHASGSAGTLRETSVCALLRELQSARARGRGIG